MNVLTQAEREQTNLEEIAKQVIQLLGGSDAGTPPDDTWNNAFREGAKHAKEEELRRLWANILALEYQQPGSVKARTMKTIENLDKDDAIQFNRFLAVSDSIGRIVALKGQSQPVDYANIRFIDIVNMVNAGLIASEQMFATGSIEATVGNETVHGVALQYSEFTVFVYRQSSFELQIISLSETVTVLLRTLRPVSDIRSIQSLMHQLKQRGFSLALGGQEQSGSIAIRIKDMTADDINALSD